MEGTYKKSKGNAGLHGVQFQLDLLTVCLLNALHNGRNWKISTENQEAGKYDDIVIELPDESAVLIQAKHKENKNVTKELLFSHNSKNTDFSLPKYFFSYQEIKDKFRERTVIICTNASLNTKGLEDILTSQIAGSDSVLFYEGDNCSLFTFNEIILPDLKKGTEIYLTNNLEGKGIDKAIITDENLKDFLKNLQIFFCYPCGVGLLKIMGQLLSRLSSSSSLYKTSPQELYRKVEQWFKQPKGEYLTEVTARAMFCEIKSEKYCESLKDYNMTFEGNDFNFTGSERVVHIKMKNGYLLEMLKTYQALKDDKCRQLYVNSDDSIEVQNHMVKAFELRRYSYLVMIWSRIGDETVKTEISRKLKEILEKNRYKKIILLAESSVKLTEEIGLEDICQLDGSVTFGHLSKDSQERLLKSKNVVFQGQRVSLEELLETQTSQDYTKTLDSAMLEELVRGEEVKVGAWPLELDEDIARYYIQRTFKREVRNAEHEHEQWSKETGGETFSQDRLCEVDQKVVVIIDGAGMGKSTALTKLAVTTKEKYPHLWVIRINLNDCTGILKDTLRKNRKTISPKELLGSQEATKVTNRYENFVFEMKEKVVLMLDGADEVSPDYTGLILSLLVECQGAPNFAKIFVTARPHMTQELEVTLKIQRFKILPFTSQNQVDFLTSYWVHNLRLDDANKNNCERYAETLLKKMFSWMNVYRSRNNDFVAVPLQVRMLAEIFQENIRREESEDWEGCKEYLNTGGDQPKLPEKFNLADLYDTFIEKKRDVFIDKQNPDGKSTINNAMIKQFEECLACHRSLALKTVLENKCGLFTCYRPIDKDAAEFALKIGILQKSGSKFQFMHRTFAEYFVASSIVKELQLQNPNLEFQRFLIDELLWKYGFKTIRPFLNNLLQKVVDTLPSGIFKKYRSSTSKTDWGAHLIFSLPEEGSVAILELLLKSIHFKIVRGKEIYVRDWRVRATLKKRNALNDLKVLVGKAGVNIRDDFWETPLHAAVRKSHVETVKFLIDHGADVNIKVIDTTLIGIMFRGHLTALHLAVQLDKFDTVNCLVEHGADVNVRDADGHAALHLAAYLGRLRAVKYLAEHGSDVNIRDHDGGTALHSVTSWKQFYCVKYPWRCIREGDRGSPDQNASSKALDTIRCLVRCGVDVNARDKDGHTALHLAVQSRQSGGMRNDVDANFATLRLTDERYTLDTVKFLVESSADVNVKDRSGLTALHLAAAWGKSDIVGYLLENHADANVRDNEGRTALHLATRWSALGAVKRIVESRADVNVRDDEGRTALHLAVRRNQVDTIKRLVGRGAFVNITDDDGHTPLHLAVLRGELGTARYLVENHTDVNVKDNNGDRALDLAARNRIWNLYKFLLEYSSDDNVRNAVGHSPMRLASGQGLLDAVEYLAERNPD